MRSLLKRITPAHIWSWSPCWSEARIADLFRQHGRKSATPLEIAQCRDIPATDRFWLLLRSEVMSDRDLRLFGCWCAEQALRAERNADREPDPRSWAAVRISRRFACGKATAEKMEATWAAAREATWAAAREATWAAREAARAAAWAAAREAAREAQVDHLIRVLRQQSAKA